MHEGTKRLDKGGSHPVHNDRTTTRRFDVSLYVVDAVHRKKIAAHWCRVGKGNLPCTLTPKSSFSMQGHAHADRSRGLLALPVPMGCAAAGSAEKRAARASVKSPWMCRAHCEIESKL